MHTFYLEAQNWTSPHTLTGQEAKHLSRVLRLKNGETVELMDGKGRSGHFVIKNCLKNEVQLEPIEIIEHSRPQKRCFLAPAYTKATRRSWLLEKAVELEAGGVWFWESTYSQAKMPESSKESWQEQIISGAKQCKNPWFPEVKTLPGGLEELCSIAKDFQAAYILWEEADSSSMLRMEDLLPDGDTLFVMGPEGGLTEAEVEKLTQSGFKAVSLGNRILRWETAALLCLSLNFWTRQIEQAGVES